MKTLGQYFEKLRRCWMKMRLRPIRVFCFHHVSEEFEPDTMWECDWTRLGDFKEKIMALKAKYTFIPLPEVRDRLANDRFRMKRYAALTADDGWASVKNVLPWLAEQGIPVTLFLNPLYLDGKHHRERPSERFLLDNDIQKICEEYPNVAIGMHGWEHLDVTVQDIDEFRDNVTRSIQAMKDYQAFVPFFAYPWGKWTKMTNQVLHELKETPVLMDGIKNYDALSGIHREVLMSKD